MPPENCLGVSIEFGFVFGGEFGWRIEKIEISVYYKLDCLIFAKRAEVRQVGRT